MMPHAKYLKFLKTIFWVLGIWLLALLVVWNKSTSPEYSDNSPGSVNNEPPKYPERPTKGRTDGGDRGYDGKLDAFLREAGDRRKKLLRGAEKDGFWDRGVKGAPEASTKINGAFGRDRGVGPKPGGIKVDGVGDLGAVVKGADEAVGKEILDKDMDIEDFNEVKDDSGDKGETADQGIGEMIDDVATVEAEGFKDEDKEDRAEEDPADDEIPKRVELVPKNDKRGRGGYDDVASLPPSNGQDARYSWSKFGPNPTNSIVTGNMTSTSFSAATVDKKRRVRNRSKPHLVWQTDELGDKNLPERYKRLKRNIDSVCDRHDLNVGDEETFFGSMDATHILVHENLRIIWCMVPKSGSTLWRKILTGLDKKIYDVPSVTNLPTLFSQTSRYLYTYPPKKAAEMLRSFPKFMFTRHPFQRLHSAYIDKILGSNNYVVNSIHEEIKSVMKLEALLKQQAENEARTKAGGRGKRQAGDEGEPNTTIDEGTEDDSRGDSESDKPLTFPQFLNYVINHDHYFPTEPMNGHWQPSYNMCMPCTISYDFVGRLEDMRDDGTALFNLFRFDRRMKFPADHKPNHSFRKKSDTKDMFRALPKDIYEAVYKVYANDFEMFNYTDRGYAADGVTKFDYNKVTSLNDKDNKDNGYADDKDNSSEPNPNRVTGMDIELSKTETPSTESIEI